MNAEAKRIMNMPTSIFSTMSKLAVEHGAVNLGQGFPDFDGPEWIMKEAYEAMKSGKNQYAPMNGILSLRQAVKNVYKTFYDLDFDENKEITITAGATEALFSTFMAFIEEGDEVIMFEPFYDSHQADVMMAGGIPKYVTLKKPGDETGPFTFDSEELENTINEKTKAIIVNNPHNPTGKVYSIEELTFIAELAKKHNLLVIADEVYEFLTFDGSKHTPIATLPGMKERAITISSTGKTFGMTGWKIGYAVAKPEFTRAIQKVHQWTTFAVNTPGQHAMAYAFSRLEEYLPDFRKIYTQKRNLINAKLKETSFRPHLPLGSYFIMADIPNSAPGFDDVEFAKKLVRDYKIAAIPPSVFYGKSGEGSTMLRFCFAKSDETILGGIENLKNY